MKFCVALVTLALSSACYPSPRRPVVAERGSGSAETKAETNTKAETEANTKAETEQTTGSSSTATAGPKINGEVESQGAADGAAIVAGWSGENDESSTDGQWRVEGSSPSSPTSSGSDPTGSGSGGSGGILGRLADDQPFLASGLSSRYRVIAPADNGPGKSHPLVVYLHGDTGSNYSSIGVPTNQPQPTTDLVAASATQKPAGFFGQVIFAALLTPTTNEAKVLSWWTKGADQVTSLGAGVLDAHGQFVSSFIRDELLKKFNVDPNRIVIVGQSGGGLFLSDTFVPKFAEGLIRGALVLCGGSPPRADLTPQPSAAFASTFRISFHTTDAEVEDIKVKTTAAAPYYQKVFGADRAALVSEGAGEHCLFRRSQPEIMEAVLPGLLGL